MSPQPPLGAWNFKELLETSAFHTPKKAESALGAILGNRSLRHPRYSSLPPFHSPLLISFIQGNFNLETHHRDVVVLFRPWRQLRRRAQGSSCPRFSCLTESTAAGWSFPFSPRSWGLYPSLAEAGMLGVTVPVLVRMGLKATTTLQRLENPIATTCSNWFLKSCFQILGTHSFTVQTRLALKMADICLPFFSECWD